MSKVALSGNALGTGTFTIASPNSNTDRTLTLPDNTGTILTTATAGVPVNGPAFSAYQSAATSIATATTTKVQFNTEVFDVGSCYDTSLYRFTPNVAGYYQFNVFCRDGTGNVVGQLAAYLYKNGVGIASTVAIPSGQGPSVSTTSLQYANGVSDYFEVYFFQNSGSTTVVSATAIQSFFSGFLARSAT
jgi:hypothetical protein